MIVKEGLIYSENKQLSRCVTHSFMSSESFRQKMDSSAGICRQSMGARNRVRIGLLHRPAKLPGEIDSLESILMLLKSLKIRAQIAHIRGRFGQST